MSVPHPPAAKSIATRSCTVGCQHSADGAVMTVSATCHEPRGWLGAATSSVGKECTHDCAQLLSAHLRVQQPPDQTTMRRTDQASRDDAVGEAATCVCSQCGGLRLVAGILISTLARGNGTQSEATKVQRGGVVHHRAPHHHTPPPGVSVATPAV